MGSIVKKQCRNNIEDDIQSLIRGSLRLSIVKEQCRNNAEDHIENLILVTLSIHGLFLRFTRGGFSEPLMGSFRP